MRIFKKLVLFALFLVCLNYFIEWEKNSFNLNRVVSIIVSDGGESQSNPGSVGQGDLNLPAERLDSEDSGESKSQVASPYVQTIKRVSKEYGIDWKMIYAVCLVESNCDTGRVGDNGESFGAFQIHLPSHPDITKEQATNFEWSLRWTIKNCDRYSDSLKWFGACHNGIGKYPRNQWYVDRVSSEYQAL